MSGGRSRRKKLVRSKRLSKTDSSEVVEADQQPPSESDSVPPPLEEVVNEVTSAAQDQHLQPLKSDEGSREGSAEQKDKLLAAASTWRAAADMQDSSSAAAGELRNPWKKVLAYSSLPRNRRVNGRRGSSETEVPNLSPPPGPWGEQQVIIENAAVHVDMGKVVGVLRATHDLEQELKQQSKFTSGIFGLFTTVACHLLISLKANLKAFKRSLITLRSLFCDLPRTSGSGMEHECVKDGESNTCHFRV